MGAVQPVECERARHLASLGLDGELSEVEQALLRAHVGRCAACACFARDLGGLTQELRAAPLQRPVGESRSHRRRATVRALQLGAAAAAVALAAGLGGLAGSLSTHSSSPPAQVAGDGGGRPFQL